MASFSPQEYAFVLDVVLALIAGILIGAERELRGKPGGINTQSFVIGGAAIFTFISRTMLPNTPGSIAAGIVTGIGFLGAGIILKDKGGMVSNITTAASVWFSAAIGMAIGFQLYLIAFTAVIFSIFVPRIPSLRKKAEKSNFKSARRR